MLVAPAIVAFPHLARSASRTVSTDSSDSLGNNTGSTDSSADSRVEVEAADVEFRANVGSTIQCVFFCHVVSVEAQFYSDPSQPQRCWWSMRATGCLR